MTDPDTPRPRGRASAFTTMTVGDRPRIWRAGNPRAAAGVTRVAEVAGWIVVYALVRWLVG